MKYKIGQKIKHGPAYGMKCSERFYARFDEEFNLIARDSNPTPLRFCGESYVVGLRMAIMSDYKYIPSKLVRHAEYEETLPAKATGKREECLVCIKNIKKFKPYLVRKKDVKNILPFLDEI